MSSLRNEVRKLAKKFTIMYQKEIIKKDLIDTGNLKRSFKTKIDISRKGDVKINISSLYYFKYLDEPFEVTEDIINSKSYKKLEDELISLLTTLLYIDIPKDFKSSDSVSYTFKFPKK